MELRRDQTIDRSDDAERELAKSNNRDVLVLVGVGLMFGSSFLSQVVNAAFPEIYQSKGAIVIALIWILAGGVPILFALAVKNEGMKVIAIIFAILAFMMTAYGQVRWIMLVLEQQF